VRKVEIEPTKETENEPAETENEEHPKVTKSPTPTPIRILNKLEVKIKHEDKKIDIRSRGIEIELKSEDDKVVVKAKKSDGTEVELEQDETLDKLNEDLTEDDLEIGTSSTNGTTITKGEVEAETHFPLTVDPVTHTLTVTTPAGSKQVTVLPDEAVQNVLQTRLIDTVENEVNSGADTTSITKKIRLNEVDNELTFEIKGIKQKKLLGIIPIAFVKTTFVSAQTGQVLKTDETLINKLLELLSF
jgi:hypothetical protein